MNNISIEALAILVIVTYLVLYISAIVIITKINKLQNTIDKAIKSQQKKQQ